MLTYESDNSLVPGQIVVVPLGRGKAVGVVSKKVAQPDFATKKILQVLYSTVLPAHQGVGSVGSSVGRVGIVGSHGCSVGSSEGSVGRMGMVGSQGCSVGSLGSVGSSGGTG